MSTNQEVLKVSKQRKYDLLIMCVREHLNHNTNIPTNITHDYILGIVIDYYLERR